MWKCFTNDLIQMIQVVLYTAYFTLHGIHYAHQQLLIQNVFALTIHKTQSLLLNYISVVLDNMIFGPGQAYMMLNWAHTWEEVEITELNWNTFLTDQDMIKEYEQLTLISQHMKSNLLNQGKRTST